MLAAMVIDNLDRYLLVDTASTSMCTLVDLSQACWLTENWCQQNMDQVLDEPLTAEHGDIVFLQKNKSGQLQLTQIPELQAALVALDSHTSAIEALVGGYQFVKSNFNRATQAYRQTGSSIKPLLYATAIENGYTMSTKINDAPIVVEDMHGDNDIWRPKM